MILDGFLLQWTVSAQVDRKFKFKLRPRYFEETGFHIFETKIIGESFANINQRTKLSNIFSLHVRAVHTAKTMSFLPFFVINQLAVNICEIKCKTLLCLRVSIAFASPFSVLQFKNRCCFCDSLQICVRI